MNRIRLGRVDPERSGYLTALRERVVIFDGATGTNLQLQRLGADELGGAPLPGCYEVLALTHPRAVEAPPPVLPRCGRGRHRDRHLRRTLGAARPVRPRRPGPGGQSLRGTDRAQDRRRVRRAWQAALGRREHGPGTKLPSLGHIAQSELRTAYGTQATALLEGGADLLLVETVVDLLSANAAIDGARLAMVSAGRHVPLQVQVTIQPTGRTVSGTDVATVPATLDAMQVDVIGLNCGTGPTSMYEALAYLSTHSTVPISALPSAGLPTDVGGRMHYGLTAGDFAAHLHRFVTEDGVTAVGGCCGTTPEHLGAAVETLDGVPPGARRGFRGPGLCRATARCFRHPDGPTA